MKRVNKIQTSLAHLPELCDAQMEITLLRSCLALPKISFVLHTCPPSHIVKVTEAFDNLMRESLEDTAGGPLSEWAGLKATLPSNCSGLNIKCASLHAPAAFLGSLQLTISSG